MEIFAAIVFALNAAVAGMCAFLATVDNINSREAAALLIVANLLILNCFV